jgi:hypothetical protein
LFLDRMFMINYLTVMDKVHLPCLSQYLGVGQGMMVLLRLMYQYILSPIGVN